MNEKIIDTLIQKYKGLEEQLQVRIDQAISNHLDITAHQLDMQREVYEKVIKDLTEIRKKI